MTPSPTLLAVRRLVRFALPDHGGLQVRAVAEGGDHSTWWVGSRYVLRLALDNAGSHRQQREIALRDAIRPGLAVQVPASVAAGEWTQGLTYTIDTRLPGISAERQAVSSVGERDLAQLLKDLRAVCVDTVVALGLPALAPRALDAVREAAGRAVTQLGADGPSAERVRWFLTDAAADPSVCVPVALVHHDLKGEHLLVTGSGRLSGVLDWTDAVVGDAAEDVAGLAISVGAAAAVRVATLAGYEPAVCVRGLYLARCDSLVRLADRLCGDDDSPLWLL